MKKLLSLLLPLALALSLTACGEKSADEAARQTPPTLTVTSANACSVTLKSSSYDWTYTQGLQSMTVIACGAHPLDETSRDITPVLEMPFAVSAAYFYTVTLDFGDNSPDSVSVRCWPSDAWGTTGMPSETVTAQRQDNGTFRKATAFSPSTPSGTAAARPTPSARRRRGQKNSTRARCSASARAKTSARSTSRGAAAA
jgi:hypothetical protein